MKNKDISVTEDVIGREKEKTLLSNFLAEDRAGFLAAYGRRRIGKTFLIRKSFQRAALYLEITGIRGANLSAQLHQFDLKVAELFRDEKFQRKSSSWLEAFETLTSRVKVSFEERETQKEKNRFRFVLFLDELPWLASPKSGMIEAIEYYWNNQWSTLPYFKLVICGSAASWMLDKIIQGKGGIHNRITHRMPLFPFTWAETFEFFKVRGFRFTAHQKMMAYLIFGGVPFYLEQLQPKFSLNQNISQICFSSGGMLQDEFDRLFNALFENPRDYEQIVRLLAKHRYGVSRDELIKSSPSLKSGGHLDLKLKALEASGFIGRYVPYGKNNRQIFLRLLDEFLLFHLRWIEPSRTGHQSSTNYWQTQMKTPAFAAWSGYAFEGGVIKHVEVIAKALGLSNVGFLAYSWKGAGAQIDLLLDRDDGVITICEIKFNLNPLIISKALAQGLKQKLECFEKAVKPKKSLSLALITLSGAKPSIWSEGLIDHVVQLVQLLS